MMKLQEILERRQSIRRYQAEDVSEAHLREMVAAAGIAPSAKNEQNWQFVAIKNRQVMQDLAQMISEKNESISLQMDGIDKEKADRFRKLCKNFTVFWKETAPALILVFATDCIPDGYTQYEMLGKPQADLDDLMWRKNPGILSLGCAIENFTLKAVELGYGSTILTSANYAAPEIEAYLKEGGYFHKDGYYLVAMLSLGVPQENQKSPSKKTVSEIYTFVG